MKLSVQPNIASADLRPTRPYRLPGYSRLAQSKKCPFFVRSRNNSREALSVSASAQSFLERRRRPERRNKKGNPKNKNRCPWKLATPTRLSPVFRRTINSPPYRYRQYPSSRHTLDAAIREVACSVREKGPSPQAVSRPYIYRFPHLLLLPNGTAQISTVGLDLNWAIFPPSLQGSQQANTGRGSGKPIFENVDKGQEKGQTWVATTGFGAYLHLHLFAIACFFRQPPAFETARTKEKNKT